MLTARQWQAIARLILFAAGTQLVRHGWIAKGDWNYIEPGLEIVGGLLLSGMTAWWTKWAHKPETIVKAAESIEEGK